MSRLQFESLVKSLKKLVKAKPSSPTVEVPKRTLRLVIYALQNDPRFYSDKEK